MSNRMMMVWFAVSFVVLGIIATLLGTTLESLSAFYDIPLEDAGIFITLHSTGVTIMLLIIGKLYELGRYPPRYILCIGPVLSATGLFLFSATDIQIVGYMAALLFGFGFGGLLLGPNILVGVLNPQTSASKLNALNVFFGVGAILGPQVVNGALQLGDFRYAYIFTAVVALALIPAFLRVDVPASATGRGGADGTAEPVKVNWWLFVPFMALLFFYVGGEVGFGAWIATQFTTVTSLSADDATIGVSLFWFGLTAGRALAIVVSRYLRPVHLLILCAFVITVAAGGVVNFSETQTPAFIFTFLVGLGCGPVFPTTIAAISTNYPQQFTSVSGIVTSVGNAGAMLFPWLHGQVGNGESGGMTVTFVIGIILLLLLFNIERQVRATARRTAEATT